jgi:hypothetical protein
VVEVTQQCQVKTSNGFATFENVHIGAEISTVWKNIIQNIKLCAEVCTGSFESSSMGHL